MTDTATNINVNKDCQDPNYRYKMPEVEIKFCNAMIDEIMNQFDSNAAILSIRL